MIFWGYNMGNLCGIVDFSSKDTTFSDLRRMWCAAAPLSRGVAYINGGISVCAVSGSDRFICLTSPDLIGSNCTVALAKKAPSPIYARELAERYVYFGASSLAEDLLDVPFALVDEKEGLLLLYSASSTIFCSRDGERIVFSDDERCMSAYADGAHRLSVDPIRIRDNGIALFCDVHS